MIKEYKNNEITVVWQPDKCIHSAVCVKGLPKVFNTKNRPWINIVSEESSKIISQVRKCPSGALSIKEDTQNPL